MASTARIDELKKKFDENPRRYFAPLANEFRKAGEVEQAIMICEEFLPQQPGHMSGHIVYGQALFEANRMEESRTVFETALTLDPENLIALRHLGDIARGQGDLDAARRWYERVLEADPRNEEIQALVASLGDATASAPTPAPAAPPPAAGEETPGPGSHGFGPGGGPPLPMLDPPEPIAPLPPRHVDEIPEVGPSTLEFAVPSASERAAVRGRAETSTMPELEPEGNSLPEVRAERRAGGTAPLPPPLTAPGAAAHAPGGGPPAAPPT